MEKSFSVESEKSSVEYKRAASYGKMSIAWITKKL